MINGTIFRAVFVFAIFTSSQTKSGGTFLPVPFLSERKRGLKNQELRLEHG
jgi:hypothetical protein